MNRLGLRVTDCTGVDIGNSDLDYAEQGWTNTPATADGRDAPLPTYPQQSDLPQLPVNRSDLVVGLLIGIPLGVWLVGVLGMLR